MLCDHNTHFFCRHLYVNRAELTYAELDEAFSTDLFDDSVYCHVCSRVNINSIRKCV